MAHADDGWVDDNTKGVERMKAYERGLMIERAVTGVAALAIIGGALAAGNALYRACTKARP